MAYTHDRVRFLTSWFRHWNQGRNVTRRRWTPEIFVHQIAELDTILFYTSEVGGQIRKWISDLPEGHTARTTFPVLVNRYDAFLTEFERLLRRLPEEVGRPGHRPYIGKEQFYARLGGVTR